MDGSNAETAVWFPDVKAVPDEATFSRAFAEFAKARLAEHVHEALVKSYLGEALIGHISRDGTAIEAQEAQLSASYVLRAKFRASFGGSLISSAKNL